MSESTVTATAFTTACLGSYFILYSGYDKKTKSMQISSKLREIFSFADPSKSYDEINKVLGLAGITLVGTSLLRIPTVPSRLIGVHGAWISVVHGLFSSYRYRHRFALRSPKLPSMILGSAALVAVGAKSLTGVLPANTPVQTLSNYKALPLLVAALTTTHFYTMEVPSGKPSWVPEIRPFGFLALVVGVAAIGKTIVGV